ncbi:Solute carrier organic anion transporter family member 6A1, partial [Galemys pyrenaicus]
RLPPSLWRAADIPLAAFTLGLISSRKFACPTFPLNSVKLTASPMEEDLVEVEPQAAAQSQSTQENLSAVEEVSKKSPSFMMTIANSLIRFYNLRKKERGQVGTTKKKSKKEQEQLELPCRLGCIVIPCCQCFNNIRCFLLFYCILILSQGIGFGLIDLSIDLFQQANHLKHVEYFLVTLTYDISSCLVVLYLSFYGGKKNIPRMITLSSFLVGFGSLLFAFPYFSGETYQADIKHSGCVEASVMVGYALGYTIGAPLTNDLKNDTFVKSRRRSWHQTWWLNYVIVTVISWSTLIPLSCFPASIQGTAKIKAAKLKKTHLDLLKDQEFGTGVKALFAAIWNLLKSPIFLFLALSRASESLVLIAGAELLPRYIENQFTLTPRDATTLTGIILIPGGAVGQLLGGVIASKLEMSCKALMRFTVITSVVSVSFLFFVFFVHCNSVPFAGINEDYAGTGKLGNLTAPCNSHCHCSSSVYSVICGRDDIGYFSPCYAGCAQSKTINDQEINYYNCSCIKDGLITSDDQGDSIDARSGTCDAKCYKLPLFLAFVLSTVVFSCFSGIPNILTIIRIVSEKYRSLALGLSYVFVRLFGTIPGPVVFKLVREVYCVFRDADRCGVTGKCWLYDKTKMVYLLVGLSLLSKAGTIIFTAIALGLFKYLSKEKEDFMSTTVRSLKVKKKKKRSKI